MVEFRKCFSNFMISIMTLLQLCPWGQKGPTSGFMFYIDFHTENTINFVSRALIFGF